MRLRSNSATPPRRQALYNAVGNGVRWNMAGFVRRTIIRNEEKYDRTKQKGDFSLERSPSLRFFEDLVRLPDHNKVIPK
jgi:hypothetical protein